MYLIPFRYRQASAKLRYISPNRYELRNVWSETRGLGDGRGVVQKVVSYADTYNLVLLLQVQRYGNVKEPMLDNNQLERFYSKFGFERQPEFDRPVRMIRYPKGVIS